MLVAVGVDDSQLIFDPTDIVQQALALDNFPLVQLESFCHLDNLGKLLAALSWRHLRLSRTERD